MTNAELFKMVFGIYAEEFWAYPKEEMLDWLTSDTPSTNMSVLEARRKRKKGKWVFIGGYGYQFRCSVCYTRAEYRTKFCPKCGAQMEE